MEAPFNKLPFVEGRLHFCLKSAFIIAKFLLPIVYNDNKYSIIY